MFEAWVKIEGVRERPFPQARIAGHSGGIRGMIETVVEELEAALGAGKSQRVGAARTGYRHGATERFI
jgi:hypothetical protein